jgi:hypothetical protein
LTNTIAAYAALAIMLAWKLIGHGPFCPEQKIYALVLGGVSARHAHIAAFRHTLLISHVVISPSAQKPLFVRHKQELTVSKK